MSLAIWGGQLPQGFLLGAMPQSLDEWLEYISSLHPSVMDLGLERVRLVQQHLHIHFTCPVFIVGGTNGKGSCCAFLEAILRAGAYTTGLYTSPHLLVFNERIVVNGVPVADETLLEAFSRIEEARADLGVSLTYFEFTTLTAFLIFQQLSLEVVVLEVGLGGRLDAVNIIDADCSAMTTVGLDHQEWLGDTRESIGWEKAHIFRQGRVAICGDPNPPDTVIQLASLKGASLLLIGKDFGYVNEQQQWQFWCKIPSWIKEGKVGGEHQAEAGGEVSFDWHSIGGLAYPGLRGINQLQNASIALVALYSLRHRLPLPIRAIREGLLNVRWLARFQILPGVPQTILDVAHNPHAVRVLVDNLGRAGYAHTTHLVLGMMKDKDIRGVMELIAPSVDRWYLSSLAGPRGASSDDLRLILEGVQGSARYDTYNNPRLAYQAAKEAAGERDRILVFGSFLTVAEVMGQEQRE